MPENTSKRPNDAHLLGSMVQGNDGYIEGMEAAGQTELLLSDKIPVDGDDSKLEALGFTLGDPDPDDPIFRSCSLPDGWKREASDHSMWSYIVDADGYRRVAVFYKAAYYDRNAHFHVEHVPATRGQANAWNQPPNPTGLKELWMSGAHRREGVNYVYVHKGRYGENAPEGKHAYSDDGRRLEVEVAPDGTILDSRQFEVEPTEER